MSVFNSGYKAPTYERASSLQDGDDVDVIISEFSFNRGVKGAYIFVTGQVDKVHSGTRATGERVNVFVRKMDDPRAVIAGTDYAQIDLGNFINKLIGGALKDPSELDAAWSTLQKQGRGMRIRARSSQKLNPKSGKPFLQNSYVHIPQTSEEIQASANKLV